VKKQFIVPFVGREQINEFQNSLYDDLDVLGCASVFTLGDEGAWSDELLSYFLFDCKWYCYLNDASLLYCLEEYFIYKEPVTYCRIKLNIGDTIYVALPFSYYIVGYNQKMVILCSNAYITFVESFVDRHYKAYQRDEDLSRLKMILELMLESVVDQEYSIFFHNAGLAEFYSK
jgi:hypothetical protein